MTPGKVGDRVRVKSGFEVGRSGVIDECGTHGAYFIDADGVGITVPWDLLEIVEGLEVAPQLDTPPGDIVERLRDPGRDDLVDRSDGANEIERLRAGIKEIQEHAGRHMRMVCGQPSGPLARIGDMATKLLSPIRTDLEKNDG